MRVKGLELVDSFQSLVNPRIALPEPIARLTGLREQELRGAPSVSTVVRRFLAFAGDELLVAHNARFDQRFLERQLGDRRLSEPPLCTAALARRLLEGRLRRVGLASLANFFGVPTEPCHRALPDAEATAQVLVHLIGLAQERGARTLSELRGLAAPRKRRVHGKRHLARGAPSRPGVYLFRDRHDQVLYVGRARDLRARLRSYFRSDRQRPSVEAALLALDADRVARARLRARGRARGAAPDPRAGAAGQLARASQGAGRLPAAPRRRVRRLQEPGPLGPIGSRRQASLAARALASCTDAELDTLLQGGPLPRLRARLDHLSESQRYEEAARLRDRIEALEKVVERLRRLDRLRRLELCLIAPAMEPGWQKAFFVSGGAVRAVRPLAPGAGARHRDRSGHRALPLRRGARRALTPAQAEDLMLLHGFIRRPPPELAVLPLDAERLAEHLSGRRLPRAA